MGQKVKGKPKQLDRKDLLIYICETCLVSDILKGSSLCEPKVKVKTKQLD